MQRIIDFFTSLRLTVVCLAMAIVLVFVGTLAQVELGLYEAQDRYFQSLLVIWTPQGTDWRIPVWPGGYLLGGLLLVNLIAAHIRRFTFTKKKIGIFTIHAGLILLLLGQFFTELFQVESSMRLEEGQSKNYSDDNFHNELAVIEVTDSQADKVVAIPERFVAAKAEIRHPELPFTIRVKEYFPNSWWGTAKDAGNVVTATQGVGAKLPFMQVPTTAKMDDENKPTALIEIATESGVLGTWTVSNWMTKYPWIGELRRRVGDQLGGTLNQAQTFQVANRTFHVMMRPKRHYKGHSLQLLDFKHDRYIGTSVPKNFSSRVRLQNTSKGEDREVLIYMNNPLRYAGETYYQGSFEPGDTTSILHVVRNPAWITPYVSCTLVGIGLVIQFMMHLVGFARKSTNKPGQAPAKRAARPGGVGSGAAAPVAGPGYELSTKRRSA